MVLLDRSGPGDSLPAFNYFLTLPLLLYGINKLLTPELKKPFEFAKVFLKTAECNSPLPIG